MNLPNVLTLTRIPLMFVIVWLMFQHWPGAPSLAFGLFIAGAISDWFDGYIARKRGIVSTFGKLMDALTDKIMVLGIMVAMVDRDYQSIPLPFVLITLCREFLVSGMRMVAASKGVVVASDGGGKTKTVTQLIAIGFLLATPMVGRDWAYFLPWNLSPLTEVLHIIGLVGFIIGTFLAVWSGWRYIVQYQGVVFSDADR
ncbi:MAG: CDP-diacylglycerol--glycerol-3-phosphate 3-phosphatidyltransferase [Opitutaceae bacterium]|nr:CDP-diacylglycerol--glycerol-3-phosphate 3-phosphatidyltransferase [Opitutaceae bacterium]